MIKTLWLVGRDWPERRNHLRVCSKCRDYYEIQATSVYDGRFLCDGCHIKIAEFCTQETEAPIGVYDD